MGFGALFILIQVDFKPPTVCDHKQPLPHKTDRLTPWVLGICCLQLAYQDTHLDINDIENQLEETCKFWFLQNRFITILLVWKCWSRLLLPRLVSWPLQSVSCPLKRQLVGSKTLDLPSEWLQSDFWSLMLIFVSAEDSFSWLKLLRSFLNSINRLFWPITKN